MTHLLNYTTEGQSYSVQSRNINFKVNYADPPFGTNKAICSPQNSLPFHIQKFYCRDEASHEKPLQSPPALGVAAVDSRNSQGGHEGRRRETQPF